MTEEERDALIEKLRHTLYNSKTKDAADIVMNARDVIDRIPQVYHGVLVDFTKGKKTE